MFLSASRLQGISRSVGPTNPEPSVPQNLISLLMHMNGSNGGTVLIDEYGHTVTRNGSGTAPVTSTNQSKFGGSSALFASASVQYLSVPNGSEFAFGTGDFLVEGWVYFNTLGTQVDLCGNSHGNDGDATWTVRVLNGQLQFIGWTATWVTGSTVMTTGQWYHWAVSRVGGNIRTFVNGVQDGVASAASINLTGAAGSGLYIGWDHNGYLNGYMDDLRIVKGQGISSSFLVPTSAYPNPVDASFSNVSMLLLGIGTNSSTVFTDVTGKPVTLAAGAPVITTSNPPPGLPSSMSFNGSSYITEPTGTDFAPGTGDYTMEAYVYQTARSGVCDFLSFCNVSSNNGVFFQITGTGLIAVSTFSTQFLQSSTALNLNQWYHVAASREAGVMRLFIDGVLVGTYASDTTNLTDGSCTVGAINNGTGAYTGLISNARFTKGVARYTAAFTRPTLPLPTNGEYDPYFGNTTMLMHMNGVNSGTSFPDVFNAAITTQGSPVTSTAQSKFGGASLSLNGSSALKVADKLSLVPGTGDFTVEAWIRPTATANARIWSYQAAGSAQVMIMGRDATGRLFGELRNVGGNNDTTVTAATVMNLNQWYHVAFVRQGTTCYLFVDGVMEGNIGGMNQDIPTGGVLSIGYFQTGVNAFFTGFIDELRFTKGVARYTANFTPPTAAFPNS